MHVVNVRDENRYGIWAVITLLLGFLVLGYMTAGGVVRYFVEKQRLRTELEKREFIKGAAWVTLVYMDVWNRKIKVPTNTTVGEIAWQRYLKETQK